MDMTAEAMQKVLELSKPEIHNIEDIHGRETRYSTKQIFEVLAKAPALAELVNVSTLGGFAELIKAELECYSADVFAGDFIIQVEDETTVTLKVKETDEYGRRETLIKATPVPFQKFTFGTWMTQEEFAIAVASKFADTPDRAYVLNMASTLTNDATSTSEDDGFTQRATVKAGLRMKEPVTLKPRVDLAPFRTFPEVSQPVSSFVFRARCDGEGRPMLMLVEADGGFWKVEAMRIVAEYLKGFELGVSIVA